MNKIFNELEKYCDSHSIQIQIDKFPKDKNRFEITLDNFTSEELKNVREIIRDFAKIEDDVYLAGNGRAIDVYIENLNESKKLNKKTLKESTKWVSDVADKLMISFEDILNIFEEYGYGKEEAKDFYDSKWNDVTDAFNEMAELAVLFGLEDWTESKKLNKKTLKEENNRQKVTEGIMRYFDDVFPLIEKEDTFRFSMYTKKDVMIGIEVFKDYIFVGLFNLDGKNNLDGYTEIPREIDSLENEILYDSDAIFEYLEEFKLV